MNLESILKYQAIDIELRKLKREMQSNENYKIAEDARRKFNEMKTVVAKSENTASKVYGGYEESLKYYDEAVRSADELIKKLQDENITDAGRSRCGKTQRNKSAPCRNIGFCG